ncbi:MAG: sigma-54-dependent Fis family transcriptional regulator [Desulfobacteraceae bacterium]|nr:sigma-54-dependent Fis family transcriptional regulator [Desulfobacteraceae bacterium]
MAKILIIDDENSILESLEMFLSEKGHWVENAACAEQGLRRFKNFRPEIVILDIRLPDMNGLEVLDRMVDLCELAKVIMITAYQDMETTIEAMKKGAFDYIRKPLDVDEVEKAVNRALRILEVDRETPCSAATCTAEKAGVIIGKSERMIDIFKTIGLLCQNHATILIQGETGTGKELIARVIHRNGLNQHEPFVVLDCSSVVETLLESELFGHEKGAFTGAVARKPGKIEQAGKGTLFLDEVAELPLNLQGKLLGFLQRLEFNRVGGQATIKSRCRIIAACNCDLSERVHKGTFKEDLYFRLRVVTISVPPLLDRVSDIPHLVDHFVHKISRDLGTEPVKLQTGVIDALSRYHWPGNVRQLENVMVEAVIQARGNVILVEDIRKALTHDPDLPTGGIKAFSLEHVEKEHIYNTLHQLGWNRSRTAQVLGISLPTLRSKIRKYEITPPDIFPGNLSTLQPSG